MSETHAQDELCPGCGKPVGEPHDDGGDGAYFINCDHCGWRGPKAYNIDDARSRWNTRAALQADPEYLAGWKLVPAEITLEMQKAYFDVIDKNLLRVEKDARFGRFDSNREAYQAMLAASPPPEYLPGQEAVLRDLDYLIDDVVTDAYVRGAESLSTEVSPQSAKTLHDAIAKALGATPDLKAGKAEVTDGALEEADDNVLRKQPTDDLVQLGFRLQKEAATARARADHILDVAHTLAEERGEHMGADGI